MRVLGDIIISILILLFSSFAVAQDAPPVEPDAFQIDSGTNLLDALANEEKTVRADGTIEYRDRRTGECYGVHNGANGSYNTSCENPISDNSGAKALNFSGGMEANSRGAEESNQAGAESNESGEAENANNDGGGDNDSGRSQGNENNENNNNNQERNSNQMANQGPSPQCQMAVSQLRASGCNNQSIYDVDRFTDGRGSNNMRGGAGQTSGLAAGAAQQLSGAINRCASVARHCAGQCMGENDDQLRGQCNRAMTMARNAAGAAQKLNSYSGQANQMVQQLGNGMNGMRVDSNFPEATGGDGFPSGVGSGNSQGISNNGADSKGRSTLDPLQDPKERNYKNKGFGDGINDQGTAPKIETAALLPSGDNGQVDSASGSTPSHSRRRARKGVAGRMLDKMNRTGGKFQNTSGVNSRNGKRRYRGKYQAARNRNFKNGGVGAQSRTRGQLANPNQVLANLNQQMKQKMQRGIASAGSNIVQRAAAVHRQETIFEDISNAYDEFERHNGIRQGQAGLGNK